MSRTVIQPGQHIRASRFLYWHHGIYMGVDPEGTAWVIAGGTPLNPHAIGWVRLLEFVAAGRLERVVHVNTFPLQEIQRRAISRLGENRYNLWTNNCEHFATWCATGRYESAQITALSTVACAVILVGAVNEGARAVRAR